MRNNKVAIERQKEIYALVKQSSTVRVTNLSKRFKVTAETIRRDLEQMEREGLVERIHGGAHLIQQRNEESTLLFNREIPNLQLKKSIAAEAAKLVNLGDIIALDSSDICYELVKLLVYYDITVISNSIRVTLEFLNVPDVRAKIITVGGYLNKDLSSFIGTNTEKSIEGYNVDKFFFSCNGFHLDYGVYENNEVEAQVKYKFTTISEESILLAEHMKFGQKSLMSFIEMDKVSKVIVDQGLGIHDLTTFKNKGIHIELAK
ncbi:DeoR/GlpR family DNA-binding transcription regulator [Priestia megaterium]|uniref:DeoR/GlpR family DNA-binding transcription regulator n=1 Tax=Priestia megaterium TaxID=1404 RepID=UPI00234E45D1|nr:DeoR/GlpR family DNA-binding transcription regulator [Priestia megaterium]MDC7783183.1 DeoR/GlpR family DNA-binding transcription regulator [Priestia megaterium]